MAKEKLYTRRAFLKHLGKATVAGVVGKARPLFPDSGLTSYRNYLWKIVREMPEIGGEENYKLELGAGIGFATWHNLTVPTCLERGKILRCRMNTNGLGYPDLSRPEKNIFDITREGRRSVLASLEDQKFKDPFIALESGNYAGLIATRSPKDIGCKYLVYRVGSPQARFQTINFLGIALVVDCPYQRHWNGRLAHWTYNYQGWGKLPWIADVSDGLLVRLPTGVSGNSETRNEGRPGMLLVSEENYIRKHFQTRLEQTRGTLNRVR